MPSVRSHLILIMASLLPLSSARVFAGDAPDEPVAATSRATTQAAPTRDMTYASDEPDAASAFLATVDGGNVREGVGPKIEDGHLYLLESRWEFTTSAAFAAPAVSTTRLVGR